MTLKQTYPTSGADGSRGKLILWFQLSGYRVGLSNTLISYNAIKSVIAIPAAAPDTNKFHSRCFALNTSNTI